MSLKNTEIYIPSTGRAAIQHTWRRLPPEMQEITTIVVNRGELKEYQRLNPQATIIESPVKGIGPIRQWLIDNTDSKYIFMMDDDMYFYRRKAPKSIKLRTCTAEEVGKMVKRARYFMKEESFYHGGVGKRTEASFYLCSYRVVTRVNNLHFFNAPKMRALKKKGVDFSLLPLMEDFHVTLKMFELGYPNVVLLDYVWNQPGSNSKGGCSTYRTPELQDKAARMLHKLHPDFVKVVTKKTKSAADWNGLKERTDVIVSWRKAYSGPEHPHWQIEREAVRK